MGWTDRKIHLSGAWAITQAQTCTILQLSLNLAPKPLALGDLQESGVSSDPKIGSGCSLDVLGQHLEFEATCSLESKMGHERRGALLRRNRVATSIEQNCVTRLVEQRRAIYPVEPPFRRCCGNPID